MEHFKTTGKLEGTQSRRREGEKKKKKTVIEREERDRDREKERMFGQSCGLAECQENGISKMSAAKHRGN